MSELNIELFCNKYVLRFTRLISIKLTGNGENSLAKSSLKRDEALPLLNTKYIILIHINDSYTYRRPQVKFNFPSPRWCWRVWRQARWCSWGVWAVAWSMTKGWGVARHVCVLLNYYWIKFDWYLLLKQVLSVPKMLLFTALCGALIYTERLKWDALGRSGAF